MSRNNSWIVCRICSLLLIGLPLLPMQCFAANAAAGHGKHSLPDLAITKIYFSPSKPTTKDTIILNVEIKNFGPGPAHFSRGMMEWETVTAPSSTGSLGLSMPTMGPQVNEVLGGKKEVVSGIVLKPGESYVSSMAVINAGRLAPGDYIYAVRVNPDEAIDEADLDNNEQKAVLKLKGSGGR
jgi:hypothetical protein